MAEILGPGRVQTSNMHQKPIPYSPQHGCLVLYLNREAAMFEGVVSHNNKASENIAENCVHIIFSFSYNDFYSIKKRNHHFSNISTFPKLDLGFTYLQYKSLKTPWEKEKSLIMCDFSFFHSILSV